jgi:hypothetical protein
MHPPQKAAHLALQCRQQTCAGLAELTTTNRGRFADLIQGNRVAEWLKHSAQMPQYVQAFRQNSITVTPPPPSPRFPLFTLYIHYYPSMFTIIKMASGTKSLRLHETPTLAQSGLITPPPLSSPPLPVPSPPQPAQASEFESADRQRSVKLVHSLEICIAVSNLAPIFTTIYDRSW